MKTPKRKPSGFTLVELLVVIAILAVLAALGMVASFSAVKKGKTATMVANMRQIAPVFSAYATENGGGLIPCRSDQLQPDGTYADQVWHEVVLTQVYQDSDPSEFRTEAWWKANKNTFMRNPLFDESASPRGFTPLNPGYAYNLMLSTNFFLMKDGSTPSDIELEATEVPMSIIDQPSKTPLVAPCDDYKYKYDLGEISRFDSGTLNDFLTEGKFPVLYVDGSVEMIRPNEYIKNRLYLLPGMDTP